MEIDDIINLSSTCKILRNLVFSPMSMKVLLLQRKRDIGEHLQNQVFSRLVPANNQEKDDIEIFECKKQLIDIDPLYKVKIIHQSKKVKECAKPGAIINLQTLKELKAYFGEKLTQNENTLLGIQKLMVHFTQDMQKVKREKIELEKRYLEIYNNREDYDDNIRDIAMKFNTIVSFLPERSLLRRRLC